MLGPCSPTEEWEYASTDSDEGFEWALSQVRERSGVSSRYTRPASPAVASAAAKKRAAARAGPSGSVDVTLSADTAASPEERVVGTAETVAAAAHLSGSPSRYSPDRAGGHAGTLAQFNNSLGGLGTFPARSAPKRPPWNPPGQLGQPSPSPRRGGRGGRGADAGRSPSRAGEEQEGGRAAGASGEPTIRLTPREALAQAYRIGHSSAAAAAAATTAGRADGNMDDKGEEGQTPQTRREPSPLAPHRLMQGLLNLADPTSRQLPAGLGGGGRGAHPTTSSVVTTATPPQRRRQGGAGLQPTISAFEEEERWVAREVAVTRIQAVVRGRAARCAVPGLSSARRQKVAISRRKLGARSNHRVSLIRARLPVTC
jgi:hypothetical protein